MRWLTAFRIYSAACAATNATCCCIWVTLATGDTVTKDAAAEWVLRHLPAGHREVLELARTAHIGEVRDDWAPLARDVDAIVAYARAAIEREAGEGAQP